MAAIDFKMVATGLEMTATDFKMELYFH